ncbi:chain A monomeric subunit of Tubz [Vibrio phage phiKT1019]|nr:chain A monomeric subunit of Tubz [Vibrio phage phiKT1019]
MSTLRAWCVGGAGINVGSAWRKSLDRLQVAEVDFVGLDTSTNNRPDDDAFVVESLANTRGGGKKRTLNRDLIPDFVKQMLVKHRPGDFNVVIYSGAGASGSTIGPFLVRAMMDAGIPVVSFLILDQTTDIEFENTLATLRSLDGQRKHFNMPVVLDVLQNNERMTRGQMNDIAVDRLNLLSLFLTDKHEEADYEDIRHLLNYSSVIDIPPALTRIEYYDAETLDQRQGVAVASYSLYDQRDNVRSVQIGKGYRVTGVMYPDTRTPNKTGELHMMLEYDSITEQILEDLERSEQQAVERQSRFNKVRPKDLTEGADGDSMVW